MPSFFTLFLPGFGQGIETFTRLDTGGVVVGGGKLSRHSAVRWCAVDVGKS